MMDSSNPLRAAYYADLSAVYRIPIIENVRLAAATYRVRLECPHLAAAIRPGQFVMLRLSGWDDPLVGRALALYDTYALPDGAPQGIDLVYLVTGKLTARLARATCGVHVDVWGPLGNGFPSVEVKHLILVAGGIGHTPFMAVTKQWLGKKTYGGVSRTPGTAERITLCFGTRTRAQVHCVEDYRKAGATVRISTDDGTAGRRALVTEDLQELLENTQREGTGRHIFCCGPEPMMEATAELAKDHNLPCHVSLETPMACGIGICFTCVARVRQGDGEWDYKRTCVDGPVFEARKLVW